MVVGKWWREKGVVVGTAARGNETIRQQRSQLRARSREPAQNCEWRQKSRSSRIMQWGVTIRQREYTATGDPRVASIIQVSGHYRTCSWRLFLEAGINRGTCQVAGVPRFSSEFLQNS